MKSIFSIVSVNFNGGDKLIKSIKSVLEQKDIDFEVIVIDNGSKDGSCEKIVRLHSPKVKLVRLDKNYGFTVGANKGAKLAKGKYLLILNNDAYLQKNNFLKQSADYLDKSEYNVCGIFPKVVFNWESSVLNSTYVFWHHKQMWYDPENGLIDPCLLNPSTPETSREVFGAMFVAPIIKKELWDGVGGFDERFFTYGEDFDLSYRMNLLGYKYHYCPNLTVRHDFRSSSKDDSSPLWSYFYFQRNYLYVILKNYEFSSLLTKFPSYTSYFRTALMSAINRKDMPMIKLLIRVIASLFRDFGYLLSERKRIQRQRKVKDISIWSNEFVLNFNPFFYNGKIVLNISNINGQKI